MKSSKWVAMLLGSFLVLDIHATATSSGTIRFFGVVYSPASAAATFDAADSARTTRSTQIYPLFDAQRQLPCDALDYFAAYAGKDSKLVSVTYN